MDNQAAYEKHMRFMQRVYHIDDIDEKDLISQFDLLLSCLPNGGKLYKYRSLCGKAFTHAYDALVNGYLWMPAAKKLNDDFDSTLITDALDGSKQFVDHILRDYDKTLYALIKQHGQKYWNEDTLLKDIPFNSLLNAFEPDTGKMDDDKIILLFSSYPDGIERLKRFRVLVHNLTGDLRTDIDQYTKELFLTNIDVQERFHVFSTSESYDLGNMWGYYADAGKGFCIEYDFAKAKTMGSNAMRYLLNTFKVKYSDVPRQMPMDLLAESMFFRPDDRFLKEQITRSLLECVLSKDLCWEHEKEWRIVIGDIECKVPIDIVSSVIIDERALSKTNAQKLIRLCRKKGWTVKIRKNHIYDTSHSYEELSEKRGSNE